MPCPALPCPCPVHGQGLGLGLDQDRDRDRSYAFDVTCRVVFCSVSDNNIGPEGEEALWRAVGDRATFELIGAGPRPAGLVAAAAPAANKMASAIISSGGEGEGGGSKAWQEANPEAFLTGIYSDDINLQLPAVSQIRKLLSLEKTTPIEEAIAAGVIPRLVQFLEVWAFIQPHVQCRAILTHLPRCVE